jgi:hypothetical protein
MTIQQVLAVEGSAVRRRFTSQGERWSLLGQATVLASVYGVALGIGIAGGHVLGLALAVPLTFAASITVAIPSLYVVLSMLDAPMTLIDLLDAATEAYRHSALVLGGLAPTLLLFSTSIADTGFIALLGSFGLILAGVLGAYRLISEAGLDLSFAGSTRLRHFAILFGFVTLTFQLAERFWTTAQSILGGLS